jgi:hypothetical protein
MTAEGEITIFDLKVNSRPPHTKERAVRGR